MHESREAEAACSGPSKCASLGGALRATEKVTWATVVGEPERQGEVHALNAVGAGEPRSILSVGIT